VDYVNPKALDMVLDHWEKLKEKEIPSSCNGIFEQTMGLPCGHHCKEQLARGKPFLLKWFHPVWRYWQIREPGEDVDKDYELTRNPAVIPRKRGRGRVGQAVSSTRRDPSHWEVQPLPQPRRRDCGPGCGRERGHGQTSGPSSRHTFVEIMSPA
jgi:hypothetical protein